jgi:apolipoprotein N-acyltransferase
MRDADASRQRGLTLSALFAALSALCFGLSFPLSDTFVAGWPLSFAWPALLAAAARVAPRKRELAAVVFVPFLAAFLAQEWWMRHITELGMPFLAAYLAGWTVILALLLRRIGGTTDAPRWPFAITLPVVVVAVEILRGDLVCSGYAWFFIAHPMVEWTEVAQIAALGGGWLLTALVACVSGAMLDAIVRRGPARIASPIVAALLLAAAFAYGSARLAAQDAPATAQPPAPRILAVQTNLPMSNKLAWEPSAQVEDFIAFARLTIDGARAAKEQGAPIDLALWPETTVPGMGLEPESIKTLVDNNVYPGNRFEEGLRDISKRIDAPLIVGSPAFLDLRIEGNRFRWKNQFNSAYLVDAQGKRGRTDKIYLTPFGEMMPIISNWDWLEEQLLALGAEGMTFDLDTAKEPRNFTVPVRAVDGSSAHVDVGVPICFEITVPWASRRITFPNGKRAAGVVLNLSNDGWFGPSRAGRRQHLQVSQLRAIELDTPVIRCANTGMSAWIDACGRIKSSLAPEQGGVLLAQPQPSTSTPLAVVVGDSVGFLSISAVVFGMRRRRSH